MFGLCSYEREYPLFFPQKILGQQYGTFMDRGPENPIEILQFL
jgi:hypothetical protein